MRCRGLILALTASVVLAAAVGQPPENENWAGVWHAQMDGQPTAGTLTLATDTGELGGTVVLDIVRDDGGTPHEIASDPHVLMNLLAAGNKLLFQVKMQRPHGSSFVAIFEVKRTAADKATIHCVNCGVNAPVVELVKGL